MGIETALFGAAAGSAAAGGATAAATTGLLGAGGAFGLGTTLGTLGTGLGVLSGVSSIVGGAQSNAAGAQQAELAAQQAESRAIEEERIAAREAKIEQREGEDLARRQKVAFLASGVELSGSPLLVMEETRRRSSENVDEILRSGESASSATRAEGRVQASGLKQTGRQAFISGVGRGVSQIGSSAYRAGQL